jgi:hypothetical protein
MYSLRQNLRAFSESQNKLLLFGLVFIGVLAHWIYELAVAVIKAGGEFTAPTVPLIIARVVVSFIAAAAGFAAAFNQIKKADPGFESFAAFAAGLGVDALTSPWVTPAPEPA